jgi:tRNA-2-methylthio-N6-dimethylallyladenosine synthase
MKKKYYIETFGCQMNVHDSEKMAGMLKAEGHSETADPKMADILIFNTCSIRAKAEQKFFSRLGRFKNLKKINPDLKIAVAGCIAQREGLKILKRTPFVDYIIGPQNIHRLKNIDTLKGQSVACEDNPEIAYADYEIDRKENIKAWVTVMYGCNNFCSYCVVPHTRGREKSRPSIKILEEVGRLAAEGVKEITFLGQNVNSYKSDIDFTDLLGKTNAIDGIERIRFVTSHPKDLSEKLVLAFRDFSKVCEHIHLPLQSGSSAILEGMNRKYSYTDYLQALKEIRFDGIFAFMYSPRPGTDAAQLQGHLDEDIKSQRLQEILEVQNRITEDKNRELKGSCQSILIESVMENREGRMLTGRTRTNKIVNCRAKNAKIMDTVIGDTLDVVIKRTFRHTLNAVI